MGRTRQRGIGLLEVILSLTAITTVAVSVLSVISRDFGISRQQQQLILAQTAARKSLDFYCRYRGYDWMTTTPPYVYTIPATDIPEIGQLPAGVGQLHIDNWYATGATSYRYEVLRVTVVISWTPQGGTTQRVRMATLVSNEGFDKTPS